MDCLMRTCSARSIAIILFLPIAVLLSCEKPLPYNANEGRKKFTIRASIFHHPLTIDSTYVLGIDTTVTVGELKMFVSGPRARMKAQSFSLTVPADNVHDTSIAVLFDASRDTAMTLDGVPADNNSIVLPIGVANTQKQQQFHFSNWNSSGGERMHDAETMFWQWSRSYAFVKIGGWVTIKGKAYPFYYHFSADSPIEVGIARPDPCSSKSLAIAGELDVVRLLHGPGLGCTAFSADDTSRLVDRGWRSDSMAHHFITCWSLTCP
jgi:hypothetical protein